MTEKTHDLAGLTMLVAVIALLPPLTMTVGTFAAVVLANQIGSAFPDFDQPTAEFYRELPAGSYIGRMVAPLLGGHRFLSHTLFGVGLIGWGAKLLLDYLHQFLIVDMDLVWGAFVLGYLSHLLVDSFTKDGVPWLFPIPAKIGFPPFRFLRIRTGQVMETLGFYPALVALNGYLIYHNYGKFADFFIVHLVK